MLRSMNDLEKYTIAASDGHVGMVKDVLFDDLTWVVRYFVVETGLWLMHRKVLISPISIQKPNRWEHILPVLITTDQVKNSPKIDTDQPVSRQHEMDYLGFYGYPNYWGGTGLWAGGMYPYLMYPGYIDSLNGDEEIHKAEVAHQAVYDAENQENQENHQNKDPNLRSCQAIIDYHVHAKDGDIGHIAEILVEENTWAVRYLVINTSNWWGGHQVLISPEWIKDIDWLDESLTIDLTRQLVKDSPEYNSTEQINRHQEAEMYEHYGLTGYWARAPKANLVAPQ
ncbi:MAG: PRC-barrel domain-containing protein [Gammaproteobacteria bacterium]|nr:PRC-barrel domain-containing protein [Gammaproteobacteria bacterium]MBU1467175.1 PRC-barrel domain-containing protein [Gammaproteobacteria bacterium]MBU2022899.1 PRC-barrel domain-containing protein [Gammaproteobacteria bacterium]MBU2239717.1 PRC-barrel domain-containing protein [Gammaproteobacteria bacterium]MBU2318906.1 PRC-barrel domain-containing protein [Gammaproteobacteria bacterium]